VKHVEQYLLETRSIAAKVDGGNIEKMVRELVALRKRKGRLWIAGLGGSAANASHAANDFRKLCDIEAYCLTDNVAELTARANDIGWVFCFTTQFCRKSDAILVLSVGGGTTWVSRPICQIVEDSKRIGMRIFGILGKDGGHTSKCAHCVVMVPDLFPKRVTPHTEGWQSVILHCIVSHPDLQVNKTKW